jgi:hypothetical protein
MRLDSRYTPQELYVAAAMNRSNFLCSAGRIEASGEDSGPIQGLRGTCPKKDQI